MRRTLQAGLATLAVLCATSALAQPTGFLPPTLYEPPVPTREQPWPQRYPGDVAWLPDVTYKTVVGYRPLSLDLYVPPPGVRPHSLVLWVHGGGNEIGHPRGDWTYGDWRPVLAELAARGHVVAGVRYRLSAEAPFPAAIDDVQDAVRFLKANAARWGADPARVVAWGLSAGGALVSLLGTRCSETERSRTPNACVQGVVNWFGPSSFEPLQAMPPMQRYLGCSAGRCEPATVRAAGALHQVRPGGPPQVLMQGGADPLVTADHATRLAQALQQEGVPVELTVYPGLGHGFDGASPAQLHQILTTTFEHIDRLSR